MTTEQRYVLDVADVLAIRVVCRKCDSAQSIKPREWSEEPEKCPGCGTTWFIPMPDRERSPLFRTAIALKKLIGQMEAKDPAMPYRVCFEVARTEE